MPWNNGGPNPWGSSGGSSGDGQRPGGPWGSGGNKNGNQNGNKGGGPERGPGERGPLPDIDQLIARAQAYIRGLLPGGPGPGGRPPGIHGGGVTPGGFGMSGRGLVLLGAAVALLWLTSGIYRVQPDEQGVVLRFGAFNRIDLPGLNYHWPWPVESVLRPAVTRINRTEIGFRSGAGDSVIQRGRDTAGQDVLAESLMLTGDENIIDIDVTVFWRISNASAYLFNTRDPQVTVKSVAESAMREVIGRTPIQPAMTELRASIETDVRRETQNMLNLYGAGVEITGLQLQTVGPPAAVVESFRDVQRANTDADRMRNEAQAYQNDIVPRARGEAARITAEADGARQAAVAEATGQTQRFLSVLGAYQQARDVTLQRMYLETMQAIVGRSPTTVIDPRFQGLMPFLPMDASRPGAPAAMPQPSSAAPPSLTTPPRPPVLRGTSP